MERKVARSSQGRVKRVFLYVQKEFPIFLKECVIKNNIDMTWSSFFDRVEWNNNISFEMEHFIQIKMFQSGIFVMIELFFRLLVEVMATYELSWLMTHKYTF